MRTFRILFLLAGILLPAASFAQADYSFSAIPPELIGNANAVIRSSLTQIEIKNEGKAIVTHRFAVTVLNAGGNEYALMDLPYDKLISIKSFKGDLFDAWGRKSKSLKKSDVKDLSATESSSLADDNRIKSHNFNCQSYPYTVVYETAVEYDGIFYFPVWMPVIDENVSIEESTLIVEIPLAYNLRYKAFNYTKAPEVVTGQTSKILQWKVEKLAPLKSEIFSVPWYEATPSVFLAPTNFRIQDYEGTMADWKGFGRFQYTLNAGRDKLPENIKTKVHQLTDGLASPAAKIKKLYDFLQRNTRYVSVQLGIGGWQTAAAEEVASTGYGDCKALSNYMCSLLKEAGIRSYYTLIKAGDNSQSFLPDFPSQQFNHVIVCVPGNKDTTWLECTSQVRSAGYMGSFTGNRPALIINEDGGFLVRTPRYTKSDNLQARKINAILDKEGNVSITSQTSYRAEQQDDVHSLLHELSKEKIAEHLKNKLSIPSYDIVKFDYTQHNEGLPAIDERLEIVAYNFATVSGKRIFITPDMLNVSTLKITDQQKRINPVRLTFEYTDTDTVEIEIPEGYAAESVPAGLTLNTVFGTYHTSFDFTPGKVLYTRQMQRNSGHYPAGDAPALAEFYNAIYKADRARIVLVKKE
jgi:hypothetical protein